MSDIANPRGRAYECGECDWVGEKTWAVEHFVKKHCPLSEAPFACSVCKFKAATNKAIEKHFRSEQHRRKAKAHNGSTLVTTTFTTDFLGKFTRLPQDTSIDIWKARTSQSANRKRQRSPSPKKKTETNKPNEKGAGSTIQQRSRDPKKQKVDIRRNSKSSSSSDSSSSNSSRSSSSGSTSSSRSDSSSCNEVRPTIKRKPKKIYTSKSIVSASESESSPDAPTKDTSKIEEATETNERMKDGQTSKTIKIPKATSPPATATTIDETTTKVAPTKETPTTVDKPTTKVAPTKETPTTVDTPTTKVAPTKEKPTTVDAPETRDTSTPKRVELTAPEEKAKSTTTENKVMTTDLHQDKDQDTPTMNDRHIDNISLISDGEDFFLEEPPKQDDLDHKTRTVIQETVNQMNLQMLETLSEKPSLIATAVMGVTTQMVNTNQNMIRVCNKLDVISQKLDKKSTTKDQRPDTQFNHALGDIRAELRQLNQNNQQQHNATYALGNAVKELTTTIKSNQGQMTNILTGVTTALTTFGSIMTNYVQQQETGSTQRTQVAMPTSVNTNELHKDFDREWKNQEKASESRRSYSYGNSYKNLKKDRPDDRRDRDRRGDRH